jgi:hypothetical protein
MKHCNGSAAGRLNTAIDPSTDFPNKLQRKNIMRSKVNVNPNKANVRVHGYHRPLAIFDGLC